MDEKTIQVERPNGYANEYPFICEVKMSESSRSKVEMEAYSKLKDTFNRLLVVESEIFEVRSEVVKIIDEVNATFKKCKNIEVGQLNKYNYFYDSIWFFVGKIKFDFTQLRIRQATDWIVAASYMSPNIDTTMCE